MPLYRITATRETHYEFPIEAISEQEAIEKMNNLEIVADIEDFAYDWFPLEITDIEEEEAK
ncbi:MAG: hypothetical protein ACO3E4_07040 [Candidatus Nanopelagicaceae bacterium]